MHDPIPPLLSKSIYRDSLELAKGGLGSIRIAKRLSQVYAPDIAPGTVAHWIAGNRRPEMRNIFEERPTPELSYVIGACKGDGCSLLRSGIVKLEVTDQDFAETFNITVSKLFGRERPNKILIRRFAQARKTLYIVRYSSRQLVELLRRPLTELRNFVGAYPQEFLRAFFDAEGYAAIGANTNLVVSVGADNCSRFLLLFAKRILYSVFGIRARLNRRRVAGSLKVIRGDPFLTRQASHELIIRRNEDLRTFATEIGFSIARKREKLHDGLAILALHGRGQGALIWKQRYAKQNGEWVKIS